MIRKCYELAEHFVNTHASNAMKDKLARSIRNHIELVAENDHAYLHKIGITTDFGTAVQVNEGVNPGNEIILQSPVNLYNGEAIKISQSRE
jgi:hypothetical protein